MCLSVPAKVLLVEPSGWRARVEYLGSEMVVGIGLLEEVEPGQYVLVHAGEAIQVMDRDAALDAIELWKEMIDKA
ncbi:HypC/HybG/HupF family hydrogenase formation chaperone [Brevibacillus sp. LEMMJ03]|uniref:HypC/HybG/HupF family hydrogenase formation chaperone n=1 Tax=Brevibacillus sp. LEMMJ03 TaxID=2595056 RepID=UPI0005D12947|nr:HypC/HybG/HupF family hydrogenase formation chaperone [Brevibacillus sp. LEMMJ03]TRY24961.1 HypC/HybG/HupF family hydrogenase formation chaperone [Brevibacillus sp. LEMMJ03]